MLSRVPKVSHYELRTDKMLATLVRRSRLGGPDSTTKASLLCDVSLQPADKAAGDGYLVN
jgi:hypothetical protein